MKSEQILLNIIKKGTQLLFLLITAKDFIKKDPSRGTDLFGWRGCAALTAAAAFAVARTLTECGRQVHLNSNVVKASLNSTSPVPY